MPNSGFSIFAGINPAVAGGFEHQGYFALIDKNGYIRSRVDRFDNPIVYYSGLDREDQEIQGVDMLLEDVRKAIKGIKSNEMKEQSISDPSKKYSKLITVVSILIPVVVAILFTVRLPNVAPLDFLPPIYASINALTALILVVAYVAIRQKKIKLHETLMKTAIALSWSSW